jgi:DNA helicase-2/ATP-dependent DNA helicase PcrA
VGCDIENADRIEARWQRLAVGDRIRHVDFGDGTVSAVTGVGPKSIAEVQFDSTGRKRLLIKISPIEKL